MNELCIRHRRETEPKFDAIADESVVLIRQFAQATQCFFLNGDTASEHPLAEFIRRNRQTGMTHSRSVTRSVSEGRFHVGPFKSLAHASVHFSGFE
ncbi:MAG: hypothetical protein FD138_3654, partial [Planctomycetota bacterium]